MTALEAASLGVTLSHGPGATAKMFAPKSAADAVTLVREELARRIAAYVEKTWTHTETGVCCQCGDPLAPYRGGCCWFCYAVNLKVKGLQ